MYKIHLEEVEENDYSLTPGRYVGYKARMNEIHTELAELNAEANGLMKQF